MLISYDIIKCKSQGTFFAFSKIESSKEIADILGCELYMYSDVYGHAVYDEAWDHKQRVLNFYEV